MNVDYTPEELKILKQNDYHVVLGYSAFRPNYPNIDKDDSKLYPFSVGIEGTATDVDGDSGWCRTWHRCATFEEAMELALKNYTSA